MSAVRWQPGDGVAVVWEHGAALFDPGLDRDAAGRIFERLADARSLDAFLGVCTAELHSAPDDLPGHGVVVWDAARGTDDSHEQGVVVTRAGRLVHLGEAAGDGLPVRAAVLLAGAVTVDLDAVPRAPATPQARPQVVPASGSASLGHGAAGASDQEGLVTGVPKVFPAVDPGRRPQRPWTTSASPASVAPVIASPDAQLIASPDAQLTASPDAQLGDHDGATVLRDGLSQPATQHPSAQLSTGAPAPAGGVDELGDHDGATVLREGLAHPAPSSTEAHAEQGAHDELGDHDGATVLRGAVAPPSAAVEAPVEPAAVEPAAAEPGPAEPVPAEPVRAEPVRAEPGPAEPAPVEPPSPEVAEDRTVARADVAGGVPAPPPRGDGSPFVPEAEPPLTGDVVLAVRCARAHPNPPSRPVCRVCQLPLGDAPVRTSRPALGRIRTSGGETIELTTTVVVGRNPRSARVSTTSLPRLLALPFGHISGSHVEIRLEGWSVLAVDLASTNGTFLRRRGEPPVRLPESPVLLVSGDVLDLGHGVHLLLEDLP